MANINEILSNIDKQSVGYDLGQAEFGVVDSVSEHKVKVLLISRTGSYEDCVVLGTQIPNVGSKGVVFFVGKIKYPCFMPFHYENLAETNEYKVGEIRTQTKKTVVNDIVDNPVKSNINIGDADAKGFVIFPRDNPLAKLYLATRPASSESEQYCNPFIISPLINIGLMWLESPKNTKKSKFIVGDISLKNGVAWPIQSNGKPAHKGHKNGKKIDVYTTLDETDLRSRDYTFEKAVELARICFANGVKRIFFNDKPEKISQLTGGHVQYVDGHDNHFHIEF